MARYEYKATELEGTHPYGALIAGYAEVVNNALIRIMSSKTKLGEAAAESVEEGGKRLRSSIALISCEAVSGNFENAIPIAVGFELAHSASLVQDDIIDKSATRRGAPTVQSRYGAASAMLVSDILLFKIFDTLGTYAKTTITTRRLAALLTQLGAAAQKAAEGEYMEVALNSMEGPKESEYINAAGLKTGSLFAGAAACGAIVGGAGARTVEDMYEYGYHLGISFQIVDDLLDIVGDSSKTGKPIFKDMQNDATNIVIMHALENADPYERNLINSMMWKDSYGLADVASLLEIFEGTGSISYARELSSKHSTLALARLVHLPNNRAKEILKELTFALQARTI